MKVLPLLLWSAITALSACKEQHSDNVRIVTTTDYTKGVSFLERRNDSAYYYFNKVATTAKDSLQIAMAYNNMAVIENDDGDDYGGQEMALASLRYLHENRERDQYCLVADYNVLGNSSLNLKNYDAAIGYYDRAAALAKSEGTKTVALNNKALVYREEGRYGQAIALYDSILLRAKRSKKEYARVLTNLTMVRWLKDTTYRAAPELLIALQLRRQEKDVWGLNSSYSHLADYYATSRPDSALHYAHEMYAVASRLASPDDELEALQKLILLSPPGAVKQYFRRYQHLSDSLQTARSRAKNQFALIRYEVEKNKAENLKLQQDNTEKKIEIFRERFILFGSLVGFVLVLGWLVAWFRNRIRTSKLRTSQKVHDVVANGLYRLMTGVEHGTIDQDQLLDDLEVLYERSRDISYDRADGERQDFHLIIAQLLGSFATPATRVGFTGNSKELWAEVSKSVKKELEPILQELMINMKKHSGAGKVFVRFVREGGQLVIRYADDGSGFAVGQHFGNGLTSTENRIKNRGGRLIFDRNKPNGLKIEIRLPTL
ncbi:MAG TPA: ATP-binding protein [Puia sp.]|nr:ATP-binding protein [Puia sp.]